MVNVFGIMLFTSILSVFSSILWIIPLGETYYNLKNYKKYGVRNPRVISSILYVVGSLIVYYDYFIYSKMSGGLDLLTSHWLIWRVFFVLIAGATLFLTLTFADETYSKWRSSSRSETK